MERNLSAEQYYMQVARSFPEQNIRVLEEYYQNWEGMKQIDLNFRFVKIFGIDQSSSSGKWINLLNFINKRRVQNHKLNRYILELFDKDFIPLRIFHSTTEWLAPNEVWIQENYHPRIIRSGFMPFENDDSLEVSIQTAREVDQLLENLIFVFSGNKSIHSWYFFEIEDYISNFTTDNFAYGSDREELERKIRRKIFFKIQNQISHELDKRIAFDSRRIVPMIGTVNGITGRKVIELTKADLYQITAGNLRSNTILKNWLSPVT